MKAEFEKYIAGIRKLLKEIEPFEQERLLAIRERMNKALRELDTAAVDQNRLEQEMIFILKN